MNEPLHKSYIHKRAITKSNIVHNNVTVLECVHLYTKSVHHITHDSFCTISYEKNWEHTVTCNDNQTVMVKMSSSYSIVKRRLAIISSEHEKKSPQCFYVVLLI